MLQQVTMHYKRLEKIGIRTTFNDAREIFFLKKREKLLHHATTSYNALQEVTKTAQRASLKIFQKFFSF